MSEVKLTISKLTDRFNGYGMPIVEVNADSDFNRVNVGNNYFEADKKINDTDLRRLWQEYFSTFCHSYLMLEISTPSKKVNCWYNFGPKGETKLIF